MIEIPSLEGTEKRTAKITIEVAFYNNRAEVMAATRTTTVHFDSWKKATEAFEKARSGIIGSSPLHGMESSIAPTSRKAEIFRMSPNGRRIEGSKAKSKEKDSTDVEYHEALTGPD